MNRLRNLVLSMGLGLTFVVGSMAAPPDAAKKAKTTPPAAASTAKTTPAASTTADKKMDSKAAMKAAVAPGPGYVWANKDSKIFHREGSRYYGKTKSGEFMKESDAMAQGYREAGKTGADAKTTDKKAMAATAGKKK